MSYHVCKDAESVVDDLLSILQEYESDGIQHDCISNSYGTHFGVVVECYGLSIVNSIYVRIGVLPHTISLLSPILRNTLRTAHPLQFYVRYFIDEQTD